MISPREIVVIDDVVTTGAELLAAVSLVRAHFPRAEVRAFGLARTISGHDVERIRDPCIGRIVLDGERSRRRP